MLVGEIVRLWGRLEQEIYTSFNRLNTVRIVDAARRRGRTLDFTPPDTPSHTSASCIGLTISPPRAGNYPRCCRLREGLRSPQNQDCKGKGCPRTSMPRYRNLLPGKDHDPRLSGKQNSLE